MTVFVVFLAVLVHRNNKTTGNFSGLQLQKEFVYLLIVTYYYYNTTLMNLLPDNGKLLLHTQLIIISVVEPFATMEANQSRKF